MSGGSFSCLYSKRPGDSFLDSLFSEGPNLLDEARKALAEYTPSEHDERKGRPLTPEERALAEEALAERVCQLEGSTHIARAEHLKMLEDSDCKWVVVGIEL